MPTTPKISVLIPSFNYARFLPMAIESVIAQDFADFEILISDDASTDDSAAVIRQHAAKDPRIRFQLHPANIGMVANWNWCLQQARGDHVKYLFGDDCLASHHALGRMSARLDANPAVALVASARRVLDLDSRPTTVWNELQTAGLHRGPEVIARCLCEDRNLIGEPSAVMFHRTTGSRGFDARWRQLVDLEMWLYLLSSGDLAYIPEPLCAFRLHPGQQSVANRHAKVGPEERLWLLSRYFRHLPANPAGKPRSARERRVLFRCLYYSRNYAARTPENKAAEAVLDALLPRRWYWFYWLRHRLTKPFINLARSTRRILGPAARPDGGLAGG